MTDSPIWDLAEGLLAAGHLPMIIASHHGLPHRSLQDGIPTLLLPRLPEQLLRRRGFAGPLTHIPYLVATLRREVFDVVHAMSASDAWASLRLRQPVVFGCTEALDRAHIADRRLRLRMLETAIAESGAVVVPSDDVRRSVERWFAVDATVIQPRDTTGHERLYRRLMKRSGP